MLTSKNKSFTVRYKNKVLKSELELKVQPARGLNQTFMKPIIKLTL